DCQKINVASAPAKKEDNPVPPNAPIDQKLSAFCLSSPSKKSFTIEIVAGMIIAAESPCTIRPSSSITTFPEAINIKEPTILNKVYLIYSQLLTRKNLLQMRLD